MALEETTTLADDPLPGRDWRFARVFFHTPSGVIGLLVVGALLVLAVIGPPIFGHAANTSNFLHLREQPSWHFPLGTDELGRDVFAQVLVATRLSLELALGAAGIAIVGGVVFGALAAVMPPRYRPLVTRTIDVMLSFPALLIAIFVTVIVGRGGVGAMLGVGIAFSFALARLASTLALSVAGREYVAAARVIGVSRRRRLFQYILPSIAEPFMVTTSTIITLSIITVSALSFLGLGVQAPAFDWGGLLVNGIGSIYAQPALALGPAGAIAISALAFGFVGEATARALNPRNGTGRRRAIRSVAKSATGPSLAAGSGAPERDLALDVDNLMVSFPGPGGSIDVVRGVSFQVERGQIVGIVGESGSGKTITAMAIAQLIPHTGRVDGRIHLFGKNVADLSRSALNRLLGTRLAVIFQDPMSSLNPTLRIGAQLTQGVRVHRKLSRRAAHDLAAQTLTEVHIPAAERQLSRYQNEFSGGMRQRTMIAMGLMKDPELLIADEPTTALDVTVQAQIMQLLHEVNQKHRTAVILISHNLALVSENCHRVLVMYAGRIVEDLDVRQLESGPMHPYTRALIAAIPRIGQAHDEQLGGIPGEAPDVAAPPTGCAFHPRCSLAIDRCSTEVPVLLNRPGARRVACHVANADLPDESPGVDWDDMGDRPTGAPSQIDR
jgi:peptide/nickel transport system ATP-binding protein/peptide/nickel transport system permease protein